MSEELIQVSEIKEVLEKYDIGKRPLSLVLGWGKGTLSRYVDGDIPTRQYSDVLKRVKNDPEFMLELLEKAVIDAVILNFGCYSGRILENMTHAERPWRETRNGLEDHEPSDRIIEKHLIESYFKQIREKYNMINVSDIRDYSRDLFEKIYH
ncbi:hypothetical protein CLTEP_24610 [Clostridium tepidiprofundi DSM 19306]|uniref:Uncharacterized protein n=1 Tax=Clostridium tepidiprofundi DSM 19306 TaxID=1121338 RepID=A0A151ATF9_9CLOT|nr:hypothetical protein CLTEP_24610 [Clostridium tepidiprofundi DSM 19306]